MRCWYSTATWSGDAVGAAFYVLLIVSVLAYLADWHQTLTIFRNPLKWRELNPVIRWLHATMGPEGVDLWFIVTVMASTLIAYWLPVPMDVLWLVMNVIVEGAFVLHNWQMGIK